MPWKTKPPVEVDQEVTRARRPKNADDRRLASLYLDTWIHLQRAWNRRQSERQHLPAILRRLQRIPPTDPSSGQLG